MSDQTPVRRYLWRVIDRKKPGRNNDWDKAILFPDSARSAQRHIDELNSKEPKRRWWQRNRYYAVGWEEWAWNGGIVRYLK